jgi:uncharacterized SAM-binding protein YcdF (DUF218 family)
MPRVFAAFAVVACALVLSVGFLAWSIYSFSSGEPSERADAAIVLGAAAWGDGPSPVFRERINHAITLRDRGVVEKIILTGARGKGARVADATVAAEYARRRGVRGPDLLTETRSRTTFDNLRYAKRLAESHGLLTFVVVSDPLHLKRAMAIADDLGLRAEPSSTPTTMYRSPKSKLRFLARETYFYAQYLLAGR